MIRKIGPQYSIALVSTALAVLISEMFFGGSSVATLSLFLLVLFVSQMICLYHEIKPGRKLLYIFAVVGLSASGVYLLHNAMALRQQTVVNSYWETHR